MSESINNTPSHYQELLQAVETFLSISNGIRRENQNGIRNPENTNWILNALLSNRENYSHLSTEYLKNTKLLQKKRLKVLNNCAETEQLHENCNCDSCQKKLLEYKKSTNLLMKIDILLKLLMESYRLLEEAKSFHTMKEE